jgi:hypothetical protein
MLGYMMSHGFRFFFSISTFNVRYIGSGVLYFFISFMNLSRSHDPNCEFNKLTWVNSGHFFSLFFLIDYFFNFVFNIKLIGN